MFTYLPNTSVNLIDIKTSVLTKHIVIFLFLLQRLLTACLFKLTKSVLNITTVLCTSHMLLFTRHIVFLGACTNLLLDIFDMNIQFLYRYINIIWPCHASYTTIKYRNAINIGRIVLIMKHVFPFAPGHDEYALYAH